MTDYPSQSTSEVPHNDFTAIMYMIERVLAKVSTATLVQVKSVTTTGQVAAVGQVDVVPLVNMIDGIGTNYKHGPIHNLAYFRLQGGSKAVIMDPKANDIGVAVFADRDISAVKKNKKQSQPGSFRRFDMADGLFFPCFLGAAPTSYVQFKDDGSIVVSPDNGTSTLTLDHAGKMQANIGGFKFSVQPSRMDINCDYGVGDSRVLCEAGPIPNVWAKST